MSKKQILSDALADIAVGELQVRSDAIGKALDAMALEQKASDGTLSQSDVDQAVAAAVAPLNQQISDLSAKDAADIQAAIDAKASGDAAVLDIQGKLDSALSSLADMTAKEQFEEQAVADVKLKIEAVQASFDVVKGIFFPPPVPEVPPVI